MFGIGKTKAVRQAQTEVTDLECRRTELAKLHEQSLADATTAEAALEKFLDQGDLSAGLDQFPNPAFLNGSPRNCSECNSCVWPS